MSPKKIVNSKVSPKEWKPVNWYKVIEEETPELKKKAIVNPNYAFHKISLPFRMVICGSTSSMKTNTVLSLIHIMPETFTRIIFVCKVLKQELYDYLRKHLPDTEFLVGIENTPDIDTDYNKDENSLIIFDDLCMEKDLRVIDDYAIRSRHMNVSCIYLTQDWFQTPITYRRNLSHIILKQISKSSDLDNIYKNCDAINLDKVKFRKVYNYATKPDDPDDPDDKANFLMIDVNCKKPSEMYRQNIYPIDLDSIQ